MVRECKAIQQIGESFSDTYIYFDTRDIFFNVLFFAVAAFHPLDDFNTAIFDGIG
jgi:hypothetical protein